MTLTAQQIYDKLISEQKSKARTISHDTPQSRLVSSQDASIVKSIFSSLSLAPKYNEYSSDNKFDDGNFVLAMDNLRREYNKASLAKLPSEIAIASRAITNPESYPDMSNPLVHNLTLVPFAAGLIARSVPNMLAPAHPLMGLTTYSSKIAAGYDRIKELFIGLTYSRPTLSMPPIRTIDGKYDFANKAPYQDALIPTSVEQYHDKQSVNMYSSKRPKEGGTSLIREYSEIAKDPETGKIDYNKLFRDNIGNKHFQKPIAFSREKSLADIQSKKFFEKSSVKVSPGSEEPFFAGIDLSGIVNFNTNNGGIDFNTILADEVFFPFTIVDMRTKMGILIRPLAEEFPKHTITPAVDEDTYIGRVGTIPRWKNASRKVTLNFFLIAECEKELEYVQDKVNFCFNQLLPAYKTVQTGESTTINMNLISTSPVVEVRYGDYLYDAGSPGPTKGVIGMLTSFDADSFRFNWEISSGRQLPMGYRCTAELVIISRQNMGVRINNDGTVTYSRFYEVKYPEVQQG